MLWIFQVVMMTKIHIACYEAIAIVIESQKMACIVINVEQLLWNRKMSGTIRL